MIAWTIITASLTIGSASGVATRAKNFRIALAIWTVTSAGLYLIGGPAID